MESCYASAIALFDHEKFNRQMPYLILQPKMANVKEVKVKKHYYYYYYYYYYY
jgi:hypothetical protein